MEEPGENEGAAGVVGYAYFVVRLRRPPPRSPSPAAIGGVVERLGTGEKRAFATAAELIEALGAWADRPAQP
jgi:hypothetical protein